MIDFFKMNEIQSAPLEPWPFQAETIDIIVNFVKDAIQNYDPKKGPKREIVVAPTGTGKSLLIGKALSGLGRNSIVMQPNGELLMQNLEKFYSYGGMASVYNAKLKTKLISSCTFVSLKSVKEIGTIFKDYYNVEVVFVDECHYGYPPEHTSEYYKFIESLQPKVIIGFTATPIRLVSSRRMAELKMINRIRPKNWDDILHVIQIQDIYKDYWAKLVYKQEYYNKELLKLNQAQTDYTEESIKKANDANKINNKIYRIVNDLIADGYKSILVFVDFVETGNTLAYGKDKNGNPWVLNAECVHAKTHTKERERIVKSFRSQKTTVLFNHSTFTTGFDYKELPVVILGRPTNSFALYYQKIGRVCRIHPNKEIGLIIDLCGNVQRHGTLEDIRFEKIPGYGWAMTKNGILMSDVDINSPYKPSIEKVIKGAHATKENKYNYVIFHTGNYVGLSVKDPNVPNDYLSWVATQMDTNGMKELGRMKDACRVELERRNWETTQTRWQKENTLK